MQQTQIYKVWGNQFSFPEYQQKQVDWSSFYFQHNVNHALRYLTKKWDDGYSSSCLIKVTFISLDIRVIKLTNSQFGNHKISQRQKTILAKKMIKELEGIDLEGQLLMRGLGNKNKVLQVLDHDEYEVIVPHELFTKQNFKVETIANFKNCQTQKVITKLYKKKGSEQWNLVKGQAKYEPHLMSHLFEGL